MAPLETFSRRDTSLISRWWWTVDRWTLFALLLLIGMGIFLSFAASPSVATRLNLDSFYFVQRHVVMAALSLLVLLSISLVSLRQVRRLAFFCYVVGFFLLIFTALHGVDIKGARRWVVISGISLQVSELVKPVLVVLVAWMLAEKSRNPAFPGVSIALLLQGIFLLFLLKQPDFGMFVVVLLTGITQFFIAGLPFFWIAFAFIMGCIGLLGAYFFLPHVARRIDQYLNPSLGNPLDELYQIRQSLKAFAEGGLWGRGPGEGIVKKYLPDAHADFVFAVAAEEFGLIVCLGIVLIFLMIVVRSVRRVWEEESLFVLLAVTGLSVQFGFQAFVNIGSSLHLLPTKGMTLPFISYGGSSMVALGLGMGMLLALTRKRQSLRDTL